MVRRERGRKPKKKVCGFCVDKVAAIGYKDVGKLRRYTTERGKILPRRISGNLRQTSTSIDLSHQAGAQYCIAALYSGIKMVLTPGDGHVSRGVYYLARKITVNATAKRDFQNIVESRDNKDKKYT